MISFPTADKPTKEPTLYDKVYNVASQVLSSLRSEESEQIHINSDPPSPTISFKSNFDHPTFIKARKPSVSVSSINAVPLLQTTSELEETVSNDVESLFSVQSHSASRAYLHSQYSRSRQRAQPKLSREYWMKDENANFCFLCNLKFSTFKRKHHCRVCGQIFCKQCTSIVDGSINLLGEGKKVRCCKICEEAIVHSSSEDEVEVSVVDEPELTFDEHTPARSFLGTRSRSHTLQETPTVNSNFATRFPNSASVELNNASKTYLLLFLEQLLIDSELDPEVYKQILTQPLLDVAAGLHLELNDRLSPREWVKIKRIPGGNVEDITCICGTVFTHQLAHRSMPLVLKNPRIMIIAFPIEYSRPERYISLEPVLLQEGEYLRKLIARISALKPSILLSCVGVCGRAMEMLSMKGIAVAQNVRESALFRLSRITNADILTSIDKLSTQPKLGSCELFEQRSYVNNNIVKTFLFFFVKPADPGRCALVRGNDDVSGVVKVVLEVMAEICYSLKAETALMRDQLVNVPNITEPMRILSSSPFVNYGTPFLQQQLQNLEDKVVKLSAVESGATKREEFIRLSELEVARSNWMQVARLWETIQDSYPFMFNPSSHQNLIVLYSLVCNDIATPCVGPDQQLIEFYLNTDQTLGQFVETTVQRVEEVCQEGCEQPLLNHTHKFINGMGMVTASVELMPCKVSGLEDCILMWSYCKRCDQSMPVAPMSSTTWKYSMGKYLELSLYGECLKMRASTCSHNVYRDHLRYFGFHNHAVKIDYVPIELHEIVGPPQKMYYNPNLEVQQKDQAYAEWQQRLERFWKSVVDSLSNVKLEGLEQDMIDLSNKRLVELKEKAATDYDVCKNLLTNLYTNSEPNDCLSLNKIVDQYQQLVDKWHSDLNQFDGQFFPTEKDIRRVTAQHLRGLLLSDDKQKSKESVELPSTPPEHIQTEEQSPSVSLKSRSGNKISVSMPTHNGEGRVSLLAKHFEELSQEFERERQREKQRLIDRQRAFKTRHAPAVAEVFEDVTDEVEDWAAVKPQSSATEEVSEEQRKAEPVKTSLIRSLANFWSERSSTRWNGIEYMLGINEHFFSNSNVVLRENEPSSLIAFSLSLPDYKSRISKFYENSPSIISQQQITPEDNNFLEEAILRPTGTHMRYYFDRSTVKASCKIFFSEQFDALRRKCMVSNNYIQSLARCSAWDSLGGKSGSAFLKTLDDRLILKELSHAEFDSFITFAPSYFEYMSQALFHDLPTVLAKLFGVYQIIIKGTQSQPIKMYVLVMENLFYGRQFNKFFDLKGSMRNRKVLETGKKNEVLLDENMVEYIYETPVFVREHSKRMLRASLYNDTLFLTKMNVMDYSLVIGLDEENNTIVAGIIDYIRTYTWDKKVESWVKTRAATSNIKEPTVVSPKQYKGRFRESMERYFVMVPDCWSQNDME